MILFFFPGFIGAFFFLLGATLAGRARIAGRIFCFFTFLALIFQVGCSMTVVGVGRATGASGSINDMLGMFVTAFLIACIWCCMIGTGIKDKTPSVPSPTDQKSPNRILYPEWLFPSLVFIAVGTTVFITLWLTDVIDLKLRQRLLLTDLLLVLFLYLLSCALLFRHRFLAGIGLLTASGAFIVCLSIFDH